MVRSMQFSILKNQEDARKEKLEKLKERGFEVTKEGVIAYKTFGSEYEPPSNWRIRKGSILESEVDHNEDQDCGFGINISTLEWVEECYGHHPEYDSYDNPKWHYNNIWKVLIKHEWLDGVCVPNGDEVKFRCERVLLLDHLKGNHPLRKKVRKNLGVAEFE